MSLAVRASLLLLLLLLFSLLTRYLVRLSRRGKHRCEPGSTRLAATSQEEPDVAPESPGTAALLQLEKVITSPLRFAAMGDLVAEDDGVVSPEDSLAGQAGTEPSLETDGI